MEKINRNVWYKFPEVTKNGAFDLGKTYYSTDADDSNSDNVKKFSIKATLEKFKLPRYIETKRPCEFETRVHT